MKTIADRVRERRQALGLSQAQLARRMGKVVSQASIAQLELGRTRSPRFLMALARALEVTPEYLEGTSSSPGFAEPREDSLPLTTVAVRGRVQAGEWREALEWPEDDWYSVSITPDPRFHAKLQRFALEVGGDSMDKIYPSGSVIICLRYADLGRWPEPGERVVVIRRNRHLEIEATVKELDKDNRGQLWLWPRSTSPEHQQPIAIPWPEEEWPEHIGDPQIKAPRRARATARDLADGAEEIYVAFKVIASYRPE